MRLKLKNSDKAPFQSAQEANYYQGMDLLEWKIDDPLKKGDENTYKIELKADKAGAGQIFPINEEALEIEYGIQKFGETDYCKQNVQIEEKQIEISCIDCEEKCVKTSNHKHEYCINNDYRVVYDYLKCYCDSSVWQYASCGESIQDCGTTTYGSWSNYQCRDANNNGIPDATREMPYTERGCELSKGGCYESEKTQLDINDCIDDEGNVGRCKNGSCYYSGKCGSAAEITSTCEKPASDLCEISFGTPVVKYINRDDKANDAFVWDCTGAAPKYNDTCEVERDCDVVPKDWIEF